MTAETAGFIARWGPEGIVEEARFRKELEALLLAAERRGAERMRDSAVRAVESRQYPFEGVRRDLVCDVLKAVLALPLETGGEERE